ncbi:hypothetical protein EZS27_022023 [termite gut metagenome]|uniref:ISXO2-like transposase domain-containing protein n=1 Tax=termite gut metagenome TaxID=433724 RepID=A0A5J4R582_9ZZZZ
MKLFEFEKYFPTETACRAKFKEMRDKEGVVCSKCGCVHHTWLPSKEQYRCKKCNHYTTLRANTVMHGSKLPFRYWFLAMHLLTATKHPFSAIEIQHQFRHKRYQPVWEMVHKLRSVMGTRDVKYMLTGTVEVDEGFFTTEIILEEKNDKLKRVAGSQAQAKVLVMAGNTPTFPTKKSQKPKPVGHIKMVVIPNLKAATIDGEAVNAISSESSIVSDATSSHKNFANEFSKIDARVVKPEDIGKVLPWVHIVISNSKSFLIDTYHGIKKEFLQSYLNEFCYKFNRRYFGDDLFERLVMVSAAYRTDFEHRIYNKNAA